MCMVFAQDETSCRKDGEPKLCLVCEPLIRYLVSTKWITGTNPHFQGKALGSGKSRDDVLKQGIRFL